MRRAALIMCLMMIIWYVCTRARLYLQQRKREHIGLGNRLVRLARRTTMELVLLAVRVA